MKIIIKISLGLTFNSKYSSSASVRLLCEFWWQVELFIFFKFKKEFYCQIPSFVKFPSLKMLDVWAVDNCKVDTMLWMDTTSTNIDPTWTSALSLWLRLLHSHNTLYTLCWSLHSFTFILILIWIECSHNHTIFFIDQN